MDHSKKIKDRLKELHQIKNAMDYTWGGEKRLLKIVSEGTADRYRRAKDIFRDALYSEDDLHKEKMIDMMERAYLALTNEAETLGFKSIDPNVRCFQFIDDIWFVTDYDHELVRVRLNHEKDIKNCNAQLTSIEELFRAVPKEVWDMRMNIAAMFEGAYFKEYNYKDKK